MEKIKAYSLFLSIFLVFVALGSIRFLDDNDYLGDMMAVHVNINNRASTNDLRNIRTRFIVLDDGLMYSSTTSSNLNAGDISSKVAIDHADGILPPGEHMVRIYVYGDDGTRRIRHRPIIVQ